jgi:hypothetical protein
MFHFIVAQSPVNVNAKGAKTIKATASVSTRLTTSQPIF